MSSFGSNYEGEGGEEDEVTIEQEPGEGNPCEKLCGGCAGMIFGMIVFPLALILLGFNENKTVCTEKQIIYANDKSREVYDCRASSMAVGQFVYFSCPMEEDTLGVFSAADFHSGGAGSKRDFIGPTVAARQLTEILVCKEVVSEKTEKLDNNKVRKTRSYSYKADWDVKGFNPKAFNSNSAKRAKARQACPGLTFNKTYTAPAGLVLGEVNKFATGVQAGMIELKDDQVAETFTPGTPVPVSDVPSDVFRGIDELSDISSAGYRDEDYVYSCTPSNPTVGCVRISYAKSNQTYVSMFTKLQKGSRPDTFGTQPILTEGGWGCAAEPFESIFPGTEEKKRNEATADLKAANGLVTWFLRVVGLLMAWAGIYCCFQPIAAAADVLGDCFEFVPCIGGFLEDFVEGVVGAVLCVISCGIGCSCGFFVIALVWLFMRPLIGGGLMLVCVLLVVGVYLLRKQAGAPNRKNKRRRGSPRDLELSQPGATVVPLAPAPMAAPLVQQPPGPQMMQVQCPEGLGPGSWLAIITPDGRQMQAQIPEGVVPGGWFQVAA